MALTISTGFVVDDAIVMIENIEAPYRDGRQAAHGRAQGKRTDRFYHHLPHRLADRRAHSPSSLWAISAACFANSPLPQRHHPDVRGRVSDPDPDDGAKLLKHRPPTSRTTFYRWSEDAFNKIIEYYGEDARVRAPPPDRHLARRRRHARPHHLPFYIIPKGLFPIQDTGVIRESPKPRRPSPFPRWQAASRPSPR